MKNKLARWTAIYYRAVWLSFTETCKIHQTLIGQVTATEVFYVILDTISCNFRYYLTLHFRYIFVILIVVTLNVDSM